MSGKIRMLSQCGYIESPVLCHSYCGESSNHMKEDNWESEVIGTFLSLLELFLLLSRTGFQKVFSKCFFRFYQKLPIIPETPEEPKLSKERLL